MSCPTAADLHCISRSTLSKVTDAVSVAGSDLLQLGAANWDKSGTLRQVVDT